jgi:hypothetical protein
VFFRLHSITIKRRSNPQGLTKNQFFNIFLENTATKSSVPAQTLVNLTPSANEKATMKVSTVAFT